MTGLRLVVTRSRVNTFSQRQSSSPTQVSRLVARCWGQMCPLCLASTIPSHLAAGTGDRNLSSPTGGCTCLTPLKARILFPDRDSSMVPHNMPTLVWATGNSHLVPTFG